jgi:hypothetical protein
MSGKVHLDREATTTVRAETAAAAELCGAFTDAEETGATAAAGQRPGRAELVGYMDPELAVLRPVQTEPDG